MTKWPKGSETARRADIAGAGERPSGAEAKLGASESLQQLPSIALGLPFFASLLKTSQALSASKGPCCPVPRSNSA